MLTTARPIFEHVPASFADPVGLADQQAQGVVSLIVVRYGTDSGGDPSPLGPTYDAFVASSGQLLAVARTTPDYRFPVTPAAALARFIAHRDAGHAAFLSLYELAEDACARFLETVFYAECLKLHVDGAGSAPLVAEQVARSGCSGGVLEVNDFSAPDRPRVALVDLSEIALPATPEALAPYDASSLAALLTPHLDGVAGRVLLYDREKNRAALPDRTGHAFDLDGVIDQANRLAEARRGQAASSPSGIGALALPAADATMDNQAEAVEGYLRDRAERPRLVEPTHPHATGLGALVAELQGGSPASGDGPAPPSALTLSALSAPPDPPVAASEPAETAASGDSAASDEPQVQTRPDAPPVASSTDRPSTSDSHPSEEEPRHGKEGSPGSPSSAPTRHPLATELDRLRTDVFALFEDAVGRDRAVAHEAYILDETGIASPVAPADAVAYLRALLTGEPPKRWHFFKRPRSKIYEEVAGMLLAFHAANGHLDDPAQRDVLHEVTKLWTRLHK